MIPATSKKKPFSKFNLQDAYSQLKIESLHAWDLAITSVQASEDFQRQYQRFQVFDLKRSEEGKKIIIDLIFVEALQNFPNLKAWKGEKLESETARGAADYLITRKMDYAEAPMLCVAEAKKDDFDQGLAQCLVEMQACQWMNQNIGKTIEVFGIVTNGEGWKFYKLTLDHQVYETELYAFRNLPEILGALQIIFEQCDRNLQPTQK
jgi:serine protease inhibitor ecotin